VKNQHDQEKSLRGGRKQDEIDHGDGHGVHGWRSFPDIGFWTDGTLKFTLNYRAVQYENRPFPNLPLHPKLHFSFDITDFFDIFHQGSVKSIRFSAA
jgi:hypothetical protein